jgi:DNA-binding NtrC family response regulator
MKLEKTHERTNLHTTLHSVKPHGIIFPISSPRPEDFSFLKKLTGIPRVPGIIVTSNYMTAAQAVSCMRFGAFDCLTGPLNGEILGTCLKRMIQPDSDSPEIPGHLIAGNSPAVRSLRSRIMKYADLPYPVLLNGETGSGKELAARTIHSLSRYADGPFTAVNCASYNDDLLGSEMFGSQRGAFTGSTDRPGLFEISNGGTLFLDEIGELSIRGQASLLRVIEEGYIRRMGSHKTRAVDVRIIAATNKDLQKSMKLGTFRNDLFFRLNLLGINVPPLRKRKEDITLLSRNYLKSIFPETPWRLESPAVSLLTGHSWPGNVRELQSVLLKASISAERGIIRVKDICLPETGEDC